MIVGKRAISSGMMIVSWMIIIEQFPLHLSLICRPPSSHPSNVYHNATVSYPPASSPFWIEFKRIKQIYQWTNLSNIMPQSRDRITKRWHCVADFQLPFPIPWSPIWTSLAYFLDPFDILTPLRSSIRYIEVLHSTLSDPAWDPFWPPSILDLQGSLLKSPLGSFYGISPSLASPCGWRNAGSVWGWVAGPRTQSSPLDQQPACQTAATLPTSLPDRPDSPELSRAIPTNMLQAGHQKNHLSVSLEIAQTKWSVGDIAHCYISAIWVPRWSTQKPK